MPNTYFQFKQFRIDQAVAGMKVTTDGCIFGALIKAVSSGHILDIGTGTGLLSLMLAQRTKANILGLEINERVALQASKNIKNSPWPDQIVLTRQDFTTYDSKIVYDQIICNPPFFKNSHKGQSASKNTAVHNDALPMESLINRSKELLSNEGSLWVMYPKYEMDVFLKLATESDLFLSNKTSVYNQADKPVFRVISEFRKEKPLNIVSSNLTIKKPNGAYSEAFTKLLKDYYLHL